MPPIDQIIGTEVPTLMVLAKRLRLARAQLRRADVITEVLGRRVPKGAQIFLNLHNSRAPYPTDESGSGQGARWWNADPCRSGSRWF